MVFLAGDPDITPITNLITTWIHIGQALVGSIGALAFPRRPIVRAAERYSRGGITALQPLWGEKSGRLRRARLYDDPTMLPAGPAAPGPRLRLPGRRRC